MGSHERRSPELFEALLEARSQARNDAEVTAIEQLLESRFKVHRAIFITDMSGFTRGIRELGFLKIVSMIYETRRIMREEIERTEGRVLKFEADNTFAVFEDIDQAFLACQRAFSELDLRNRNCPPDERLEISVGLGFGPIYLVGEDDFFGIEVNLASKLGEDTAEGSQVLLTNAAYEELSSKIRNQHIFEERETTVSGVTIPFYLYSWNDEGQE